MFMSKKHVKSAWVSSKRDKELEKKPWGHEHVWSGFNGIHGKTLFINKGCRTSLKYHALKAEVLYLRQGKAEVTFGDELTLTDLVGHEFKTQVLMPGESLMVQSGCPYRIKAILDCEIIEIGNNLSDKPIRIKDDYGRAIQSTKSEK